MGLLARQLHTVLKQSVSIHSHSRKRCTIVLPPAKVDKYGGITLDIGQLTRDRYCSPSADEFDQQLKDWMHQWQANNVKAAWLQIPIHQGAHMSVAAQHGFTFHNAEGNCSLLVQWLDPDQESRLPMFATHQVGCSGCVIREDTEEVLVVKDRHNPFAMWKFPGGLADLGEDVSDASKREVWEETGIRTEFEGIMMMRQQHQHPGAFGRSDMFFVSLMRPLNFDIDLDPREITDCCWMSLNELASSVGKSAITVRAVKMAKYGLKHGFDKITMDNVMCKSVFKGLEFKVYNARVPGLVEDDSTYQHSLGDVGMLTDVRKKNL